MADDDREIPINGEDNSRPEDFFDDAENGEEARVNELTKKLKSLEIEKSDLVRNRSESKEKIESLEAEIASLRKQDAELREKVEAMGREIELFEDGQKALESIRKRSVELETEVFRLQSDLNTAMNEGDEAKKKAVELKKVVEEKHRRVEGLEKEVEDLKGGQIESEIRVKDLERKIGVLKVKETEEKSEKVMVERALRDKIGEKEVEICELKEKIENLETVIRREALELEKWKKEKSQVEETLRSSEKKAKEMELKAGGLQGELGQAENIISELKEKLTSHAASNGNREIYDDPFEEPRSLNLQWPLIVAGSAGAITIVAAISYIRYSKCSKN